MLSLPSPLQSGVASDEAPPPMTLEEDHSVVMAEYRWSAFKEWYMRHWASPECEERQAAIQTIGGPGLQKALTVYFQLWSWPGEALYVVAAAIVMILYGTKAVHIFQLIVSLGFSICLTSIMKDRGECPRPSAPPVIQRYRVVHAMEFGFPSTHTAIAVSTAGALAKMAIERHHASIIVAVVVSAVYVAHVGFSRYYLGAHHFGDTLAGGIIGVASVAVSLAISRVVATELLEGSPGLFLWWIMPAVVARGILMLHVTPRQFCPCVIDAARTVGFIAGMVMGKWLLVVVLGDEPLPMVGTLAARPVPWILGFLVAMVLAGLIDVLGSPVLRLILEPYFRFISGECVASVCPSLRQPYLYLCVVLGLLSFKLPRSSRRRNHLAYELLTQEDQEYRALEEDSPERRPPSSPLKPQGSMVPDDALENRGVAWPLRTFRYWTEAQVMRRFWTYWFVGFYLLFILPYCLIKPIFAKE